MAEQYQKPYLESSVWLGWIKGEGVDGLDRGEIAKRILDQAQAGAFKVYTSTLTLAEVHKLRSGPVLPSEHGDTLLAYFEHEFTELIDVDRGIGEEAHRLCRTHGIYPADAIHLASALRAGCDILQAWDNRFTNVKLPNIRVEEPRLTGQSSMELPEH